MLPHHTTKEKGEKACCHILEIEAVQALKFYDILFSRRVYAMATEETKDKADYVIEAINRLMEEN
ncbi:MAG: hypothetical protein LUH07_08965, partial [Lachnospiraceae bacterium]|nr:hypothetical protein [Lachnospiraceae bacterium]